MKGSSIPNAKSTKPKKIGVAKGNRTPIKGKAAKMGKASAAQFKSARKLTKPRAGSQY